MSLLQSNDIGIGLIGYGYWGPNLARNFARTRGCALLAVCDSNPTRAELARLHYPQAHVTQNFAELLANPAIKAVVIATQVDSHYSLSRQALEAGKDILVEKPFTTSSAEGEELVTLAKANGCLIGVDHTFLYTGAVMKIKELVDSGTLGDIIYMDSVRVNLGLFQHDVNVIWDLAPHDLSIFSFVSGQHPVAVRAMGHKYGHDIHESIAYLHLDYAKPTVAHCHLNWVSPVKVRLTMIAGSQKMIVYDDMSSSEKVKIYDKGITVREGDREAYNRIRIDYRTGDMWAPKHSLREALDTEAELFVAAVHNRKAPPVDGAFGLEIVRQLEACQKSLASGGERVELR